MSFTLAITGHRPPKIGGYNDQSPKRKAVRKALYDYFVLHKPEYIITGGALGVDTDAARMAYKLGIPYSVIAPCVNHSSKWPVASQISYNTMCSLADKHVILDVPYSPKAMQERNKVMVDQCDKLLAVWDGGNGGTGNCVDYARSLGKRVDVIDPAYCYLDDLMGRCHEAVCGITLVG